MDICEIYCDLIAVNKRDNTDIIKHLEKKIFPIKEIFNKRKNDILKILNLLTELKYKKDGIH